MPSATHHNAQQPAGGSGADFYLHVQTKRAGKIKGEATSSGHTDDIIVSGWHWGLRANSALGSVGATERRSYTALTIQKQIDRATTGLMSALVSNDEVKEAKLCLRRAGGAQEDYFTVILKDARISSVEHTTDAVGHCSETVSIAFTKVEVEYRPQLASGLRGGATSFADEIYSVAG